MKFLKYQMAPAQWETLKPHIQKTTEGPEGPVVSWDAEKVTAVVELGFLCEQWGTDAEGNQVCEVTSPLYAVDILWAAEPLEDFAGYVVWPAPCGVHIIAGWEESYAQEYCLANPEAAYCQPPQPIEQP